MTCHLGNTQKSPEVNDLILLFLKVTRQHERKNGDEICFSVLFFGIYEPSFLSLYDQMFINRRVFVPSVSVSMRGCKRHILSNLSIIKS